MRTVERYGWIPQLPDHRDLKYAAPSPAVLPPSADLRAGMPLVYDQLALGSCTANAIAAALEFCLIKEAGKTEAGAVVADFVPSRLYIYYQERLMEGTVSSDSGAQIRDGLTAVAKGYCREGDWNYNISTFALPPSALADQNALYHRALKYEAVGSLGDVLARIGIDGFPVVFGFTVPSNFETPMFGGSDWRLHVPPPGDQAVGGHAVLAVGYNQQDRTVLVRNSWGSGWGLGGYFLMDYEFFTPEYTDDYWTIELAK